jgi:hypothetical protein
MCEAPDALIADNSEMNELPSIDAILADPSPSSGTPFRVVP